MSENGNQLVESIVSDNLKNHALLHLRRRCLKIVKNAERLNEKTHVKKKRVHAMRIALRRLRTGLSNFRFYFLPDDYAMIKDCLIPYNEALAQLRELDVFQIELERLMKQSYTHALHQGLVLISNICVYQRQNFLQQLFEANEIFLACNGLSTLKELVGNEPMVSDLDQDLAEMKAFANNVVIQRSTKLLSLQDCLTESEPSLAFHEMRIELKSLRYTLEEFDPYFDDAYDGLIKNLQPLQDAMGAIHDRQMWLSMLDAISSDIAVGELDKGEQIALGEALKLLRQQWHIEILEQYRGFQKLWFYLKRDGIWDVASGVQANVE